jgi:Ca-activated chloride channel family protein
MKRPNLIIKAAILALALSCTFLAQEPSPAVKPAGPTVQLSLIVTDSKNKSLNTVSKEDIRLVEDKVEQTVLSVEPDVRPVDLGLAIDSSGSVRRLIGSILEAARHIVVNRQPKDEIFIERFISTDKIQKLQDFTSDENVLTKALDSILVEGGQSAVVDAVYTAANYVAEHNRNSDRRKVLVLFTDGEDRLSTYKLEKLLSLLRQKKVQVFIVGLTVDLDNESSLTRMSPRDKAEKLLNTLAEESGGRAFFPKDKSELNDSLAQIVHDLQGQFRLTYQSSNGEKKGFRNVEVKLISESGEKRKAIVPRGYETQ